MKKGFYGGNSIKEFSIDTMTKADSSVRGNTARGQTKPDWIKTSNDYFNMTERSKLNLTSVNSKLDKKRKRQDRLTFSETKLNETLEMLFN
jgi:phage terminase large subunit GpA-like protein